MQGAAKTDNFMLGSATVMLGPQADLFNLTEEHSIGLVKNVTAKTTPGFVSLTQGVQNSLVYSVMNSNEVGLMAEMYEYTPRNIAYSLSLDGDQFERQTVTGALATAYAAPVGPATVGLLNLELVDITTLAANDYVMIHTGNSDNVMLRKLTAVDSTEDTVTLDTDMDGDGEDSPDRVSGCWINYKRFSGSLAFLLDSGELWDECGVEHKVEQSTINDIEEWANENGY